MLERPCSLELHLLGIKIHFTSDKFTFSDFLVFFGVFRFQAQKLDASAEQIASINVAALRTASHGRS